MSCKAPVRTQPPHSVLRPLGCVPTAWPKVSPRSECRQDDSWQGGWSLGEPHHALIQQPVCSFCSNQYHLALQPSLPSSAGDPSSSCQLPQESLALPGVGVGGKHSWVWGRQGLWRFRGLKWNRPASDWTVGRGRVRQVELSQPSPWGLEAAGWAQRLGPHRPPQWQPLPCLASSGVGEAALSPSLY